MGEAPAPEVENVATICNGRLADDNAIISIARVDVFQLPRPK